MSIMIPYAVNLSKDPRVSNTTYVTPGSGSTAVQAYDYSYSGGTSVRVDFSGDANYVDVRTNNTGDWGGETTGIVQDLRAKIRVRAPVGADLETTLSVVYEGSQADAGVIEHSLPSGTGWNTLDLGLIQADPGEEIQYVVVRITNREADPLRIHIGGFDVRSNQEVDSFVVGDGQESSWFADPNNSVSIRRAYVIRPRINKGAQFRYSVKYFRVNRKNVIQDDITDYVLPTPSINIDLMGEATKGTLTIGLSRNGVVLPFADQWISPRITIEHPDGSIEGGDGPEGMLGLYSVEPSSELYESTGNTYSFQGYDLLWVLEQEHLHTTQAGTLIQPEGSSYLGQQGGSFREHLRLVFEDGGFTEEDGMLTLPNPEDSPAIVYPWGAEVGTSRLDYITKTTDAMAWRRPWITLQGQATSAPKVDLASVDPDVYFISGDTSDVRWPFQVDPEPENMANRINVVSKLYGHPVVINLVIENSDSSHPFSTISLGYTRPDGSIQKRYIDAPILNKSSFHSVAEAEKAGLDELSKLGMLPYTVRMKTRAMIRQLNEVYYLDIRDAEGDPIENGQGKYWCVGWQMNLGAPWEMTHNLRRIIPIFDTVYGPEELPHGYPVPNHTLAEVARLDKKIANLDKKYRGKKSVKGIKLSNAERKEIQALKKQRNEIRAAIRRGDSHWVTS